MGRASSAGSWFTIGALILRIGFGAILYNYKNPQNPVLIIKVPTLVSLVFGPKAPEALSLKSQKTANTKPQTLIAPSPRV